MTKVLSYTLLAIGPLSGLFFLNYKGTTIPAKELWFVLSIFIGLFGAYLYAKNKLQASQKDYTQSSRILEIENLKRIGEKIKITLDNCEVKERSYQHDASCEQLPGQIEMFDALYDDNRNHKSRGIIQTYIVFQKKYGSKTYKFVSQHTTQNADILKRYIENNKGIDLYVDRGNPRNYYYDLPFM